MNRGQVSQLDLFHELKHKDSNHRKVLSEMYGEPIQEIKNYLSGPIDFSTTGISGKIYANEHKHIPSRPTFVNVNAEKNLSNKDKQVFRNIINILKNKDELSLKNIEWLLKTFYPVDSFTIHYSNAVYYMNVNNKEHYRNLLRFLQKVLHYDVGSLNRHGIDLDGNRKPQIRMRNSKKYEKILKPKRLSIGV